MAQSIHLSAALTILNEGKPVDLLCWSAKGEILRLDGCVSLRYDYYGGHRNIKLLASGQIRKIRDVNIFGLNGMEVYL